MSADGGGPGGDGGGAAPSPPPARRPLPPSPPPTIDPWLRALPLLGLATLTGVLCWVYAGVFRGEVCGDDNSYHFAEAAFLADALRQGDLDWWNPAANAGFPSGYYYQLVPAAIPGVLAAIFGGVLFWFQLTIFLSMVLVPAATYRGLRLMGAEPWPALGRALAVSFVLSGSKWGAGAEGVFWVGLYTQGVAMVAYPLALGSGWRWLVHGRGAAPAVAWGLFVGLCHPVAGVCLGLALAVALPVALVEQAGRERRRHLGPPCACSCSASSWSWARPRPGCRCWSTTRPSAASPTASPARPARASRPCRAGSATGYFLDHERRPPRVLTGLMVPALVLALVCFALRRHRHLAALWLSALFFAYVLGVGPSLRTDDDLFPAVRVMGALQVSLAMAIGAGLVAGAVAAIRGLEPLRHGDVGQGAIAFLLFLAMIGVAAPAVDQHRGAGAGGRGLRAHPPRRARRAPAGDPGGDPGPDPEPGRHHRAGARGREPLVHDPALRLRRAVAARGLRRRRPAVVAQLRLPPRPADGGAGGVDLRRAAGADQPRARAGHRRHAPGVDRALRAARAAGAGPGVGGAGGGRAAAAGIASARGRRCWRGSGRTRRCGTRCWPTPATAGRGRRRTARCSRSGAGRRRSPPASRPGPPRPRDPRAGTRGGPRPSTGGRRVCAG
ncbi:MAG: hypothetical protein HS111_29160 [Kofleriaceae bacterium]|nr:hypothetical protein [Kofleriaceae bacterium]